MNTAPGTRNFELTTLDVGARSYMYAATASEGGGGGSGEGEDKYEAAIWGLGAALFVCALALAALATYSARVGGQAKRLRHSKQWAAMTRPKGAAAVLEEGGLEQTGSSAAADGEVGGGATRAARAGTTASSQNIDIGALY